MPDPRFFEDLGPVPLGDLAAFVGVEIADPAARLRPVQGVAVLDHAGPGAVTFLADRRYLPQVRETRALGCFIAPAMAEALPEHCMALVTAWPQAAYAAASARLHRPRVLPGGAAISADASLESDVMLGPGVVIGPGARIGRGTRIGAGSVIGPGVAIGRGCEVSANVTIGFALIGDRVRILAGAVIGEPGSGRPWVLRGSSIYRSSGG